MYCYRKVTEDLYWIGGNDRRSALFEAVYPIPRGVSYNSYLLLDEQTVLFDTVDMSIGEMFFENLAHLLGGRSLDYVVVHHMEPDHSATLGILMERYPQAKIICNAKTQTMIRQFFAGAPESRMQVVKENDTFSSGRHSFRFVFAPFVHWPEVMFSYDETDRILFSADAFGTFGALNGAIFADEVDFAGDYLGEARRYYANIVGKYGTQVTAALKKAASLDIAFVCPLHGFVWRKDFSWYLEKYQRWSSYTPEETGVVIACASIYGHTANAAEILACRLREKGIPVRMYDLSVTEDSEVIAQIFRYSHVVFAAPTYNSGIFVRMDQLLRDMAAHAVAGRTVAFMENGTWGPLAAKQMKEILEGCKRTVFLENTVTIRSALKEEQLSAIAALADAVEESMKQP